MTTLAEAAVAPSVPMNPRVLPGWAESVEFLSRPLTDAEARPLLEDALKRLLGQGEAAVKAVAAEPALLDRLLVAEAQLRISLSRRLTSLYGRLEELNRAEQSLRKTIEIYRTQRTWMLLAICLTERAKAEPAAAPAALEEARKYVEAVYHRNPNASEALRQHAVILLRSAENSPWKTAEPLLGEAQRLLDQSRSLDPSDYLATCLSADVLLRIAERLPREGATQLIGIAKEHYTAASKLDDSRPNAFIGLGWADLLLARRSSGVGALTCADAVLTSAQQALAKRPDLSSAYRLLGNSKSFSARISPRDASGSLFEKAFQYFDAGNRLRPDDHFLLADWAFAYLGQSGRQEDVDGRQNVTAALQKIDAALGIEPSDPHAHIARGDALVRLARLDERSSTRAHLDGALAEYQTALRISPDREAALVGSAIVLGRLSSFEKKEDRPGWLHDAYESVRRALDIRADNEYGLQVLGDVLWHQALDRTDYAQARDAYSRALAIDYQLEQSRFRVAEIDVTLAKINRDPQLMAAAIDAWRANTREFSGRARAYSGLGHAIQRAVTAELAPGDPIALLEESIAVLRQASAQEPRNIETIRGLRASITALAERQKERREDLLEEARRLNQAIAGLGAETSTPMPS